MRVKAVISTVICAALVFVSQTANAGSQAHVNIGIPAIQFEISGGGCGSGCFCMQGSYYPARISPCRERVYVVHEVHPQRVWVEGHYRWEKPRRVWVPGHWENVTQKHRKAKPEKYWNKPGHNDGNGWGRHSENWD